MNIKLGDFLKDWKGDVRIEDVAGAVYCSFRENVTTELKNKDIINIKLEKNSYDNLSGNIIIIIDKIK